MLGMTQPIHLILYCQDKPQILCKGVGQPSPNLPSLSSTSCSCQTVFNCPRDHGLLPSSRRTFQSGAVAGDLV